jgi:hypothetical protein
VADPTITDKAVPAPVGYIVVGPSDEFPTMLVADWDGDIHATLPEGEAALRSCHAHGYVEGWRLYALVDPAAVPHLADQPATTDASVYLHALATAVAPLGYTEGDVKDAPYVRAVNAAREIHRLRDELASLRKLHDQRDAIERKRLTDRDTEAVQDQRIEIARALGLADDIVFDLGYLVDSIERLRQSADRDTETAALRAALDRVKAEHEHVYLDEHYRESARDKALYARCDTCGNLPNGTLDCPTLAAASLRGGE